MDKIDGPAIAASARALYKRELSPAQSGVIGEIVARLAASATEVAKHQPMEAEPSLFGSSLAKASGGRAA